MYLSTAASVSFRPCIDRVTEVSYPLLPNRLGDNTVLHYASLSVIAVALIIVVASVGRIWLRWRLVLRI